MFETENTIYAEKLLVRVDRLQSPLDIHVAEEMKMMRDAMSKTWTINLENRTFSYTATVDKYADFVPTVQFLASMDLPVKLIVFLSVLLGMIIASSITTGVLMHNLMTRLGATESMSDKLKDRVNQLESYQRAGPTQSTITETKLQEHETKTDANKTTFDADFQVITLKLAQLENKTSSLIQDHDTIISQLDEDKATDADSIQALDARISKLEADGTGYQSNIKELNGSFTQFALDILSLGSKSQTQQAMINQLELDRTLDRADIEVLLTNLTDFKFKRASDLVLIQDLDTRISQIDINQTATEDTIKTMYARVSELEVGNRNDFQTLNSTSMQLSLNISSTDAMVQSQETRITQLEFDRATDRVNIENLLFNLTDIEHQRASDRDFMENQNNTVTQLQANLFSQAYAIDDNTMTLRNVTLGLELNRDSIRNLSDMIVILETNRHSDLSTIKDNGGRLLQLEQHRNETDVSLHSLEKRLSYLEGAHVGFTVTAPVDNTDPRIFQTVIYNSETGFNPSTGIFVCRHSGLYLFTVTVIREPGINEADCFISVNGSEKLRVFANDNKAPNMGFPSASGTLVVHLSTGDEVYLTRCSGTYMLSVSSFSGILIQPDTE